MIGQFNALASFGLFTLVRNSQQLFQSFGFQTQHPAFVAFILFNYISGPLDEVRSPGPPPQPLQASMLRSYAYDCGVGRILCLCGSRLHPPSSPPFP